MDGRGDIKLRWGEMKMDNNNSSYNTIAIKGATFLNLKDAKGTLPGMPK